MEDDTVTLRDRDSTRQVRLPIDELETTLRDLQSRERAFHDLVDE